MQNDFDVIVIGGGPAGCSAAMYVARCRWRTLLINRDSSYGHLGNLGNVSCFPGFTEAVAGKDLLDRMRKQAEIEGVKFLKDTVTAIAADTFPIRIMNDKNEEFTAKVAIVATGAAVKSNYLHGEKEFLGRGVSEDAIADGPSVAKRITAVIGRNKQAAEAVLYLARFAERVHFIIPSSKLEIRDDILEKLQNNRAVELHFSTSLKRIAGGDHVRSISVLSSGQEKEIQVTGVFSYVHNYQPTTSFLEKIADLAENGSIKVDNTMATTEGGVYACGDVLCGRPQLPVVAAAQGIVAGINVDKFLTTL